MDKRFIPFLSSLNYGGSMKQGSLQRAINEATQDVSLLEYIGDLLNKSPDKKRTNFENIIEKFDKPTLIVMKDQINKRLDTL
jgi:hypothetical protein